MCDLVIGISYEGGDPVAGADGDGGFVDDDGEVAIQAVPTLRAAWETYSRLALPSLLEGVPTAMKTTSVLGMSAWS